MLSVTIPETELFDEARGEFVDVPKTELRLEHSLISLSKWEAKWKKPFLHTSEKTTEETLDYIRCMTLNQNVDPNIYLGITPDILSEITEYINDEQTATWFSDSKNGPPSREIVTSEIIYYWMTAHNIPFDCAKWHLSRLLTLVRVCNVKNAPDKKMSKSEILHRNRKLNAARRAAKHTKG